MTKAAIEGGHSLNGVVRPSGNKNAALPIIAATLMTDSTCHLTNVPGTVDVINILRQAASLGCAVRSNDGQVDVTCSSLERALIGPPLPSSPQASLLLSAPLLHRLGEAQLEPLDPNRERLAVHFKMLVDFGVRIETSGEVTKLKSPTAIRGCDLLLDETSVTATELAILLAVTADGVTSIRNAACEPHVRDLVSFLNACGANIQGGGTNFLRIDGVKHLTGVSHRIIPDHIEVGSLIAMAAITRGQVTITDIVPQDVEVILQHYRKLGITAFRESNALQVPNHNELKIVVPYSAEQAKLSSAPWPGFPSDLIPLVAVVASQASGSLLIHDKLYDSRMYFLDNLISMGGRVVQCDPHRAVIVGPDRLRAGRFETPDIRAGLALLGAALVANGVSIIEDVHVIDRIFHDALGKLVRLGAVIRRLD